MVGLPPTLRFCNPMWKKWIELIFNNAFDLVSN